LLFGWLSRFDETTWQLRPRLLLFLALSGVLVPHRRPSSAIDTELTVPTLWLVARVLVLPLPEQRLRPTRFRSQLPFAESQNHLLLPGVAVRSVRPNPRIPTSARVMNTPETAR
jgi:hypothetical protein